MNQMGRDESRPYVYSLKILFSHFNIANITKDAETNKIVFTQKKSALYSYLSQKLLNTPESLFPIDVARNHPPIIKAVNLGGLSFETSDKPIGLKNNSPIVITA